MLVFCWCIYELIGGDGVHVCALTGGDVRCLCVCVCVCMLGVGLCYFVSLA